MIRHIHPFPARMAPELAVSSLGRIGKNKIVLDPMAGSGVVIRHACELGHEAIGCDTDPLAVLMTKAWTTPVNVQRIDRMVSRIVDEARALDESIALDWIDNDEETLAFTKFWFGEAQRKDLRRLSYALSFHTGSVANVLRIALSRIIITKSNGASLARDVSHSRPHKVADRSDYDVFHGFKTSLNQVIRLLSTSPPPGGATIMSRDARKLTGIENGQVDAVVTSPPYLNAIDYLRGHRLSLVWLGHTLSSLRKIRSSNIGAESMLHDNSKAVLQVAEKMGAIDLLPNRFRGMTIRYAFDILKLTSEISRVLTPAGRAVFVVGNSCLHGVFIKNSSAVSEACKLEGLRLIRKVERELPAGSRYLPMTGVSLAKRMRTETILTFKKD